MELQSIFNNETFLNKILEQKEHDIYARITALNNKEEPLERIEGKITSGSINIDGDSAIRRTCSLTIVSDNVNINEYYWSIKTKFKLEIGLYNHLLGEYSIQNNYPKIIWFPQGFYVISTFNSSLSTNSYTISISGKDKMSLLNGELGGQLFSSIDFGTEEIITDFVQKVENPLLDINSKEAFKMFGNKYYIKCTNSVVEKIPSKANTEELYPQYIFIKDTDGIYYTDDKIIYNMIKENERKNEKYSIYQLITSPLELYKEADVVQYDSTTNFYEDNNQYKQDNSIYPIENRQYYYKEDINADPPTYIPVEYFYEKNKFYHKRDSESYFILDTDDYNEKTQYYVITDIYERKIDVSKEKIPVKKIIQEAVHAYAKEPYNNILIKDLNDYGLEKLTYKGDNPVFITYNIQTEEDENIYFPGQSDSLDNIVYTKDSENQTIINPDIKFYNEFNDSGTSIYISNGAFTIDEQPGSPEYKIKKIEFGEDIGYRLTELTYTGDLISNIGETLTSVLDKIKTMLGEFEYFYDLEGKFVFQKKKNYLQTSWSQLTLDEQSEPYIDFNNNKISYNFIDNIFVSTIQSSPAINNIRNDFTVWGKRKGLSGVDIPIHARYAIDKKPIYYQNLEKKIFYNMQNEPILNFNLQIDDYLFNTSNTGIYWWNFTKLIDFLKTLNINLNMNDFAKKIVPHKGISTQELKEQFPSIFYNFDENIDNNDDISFISITSPTADNGKYIIKQAERNGDRWSLENYYDNHKNKNDKQYYVYIPSTDLIKLVDWREIIYQMALDYFAGQGCSENNKVYLGESNTYLTNPDNFLYEVGKRNRIYYPTGYTGYEQYYTDLQGFWRQLYNPNYIPIINYSDGYYDEQKKWQSSQIKDCTIEYYCNAHDKHIIQHLINLKEKIGDENIDTFKKNNNYNKYILQDNLSKMYWNKEVFEEPEVLNFWFDFLDDNENTELEKFSILNIGDRSKVINEDKATSISFKTAPNIILLDNLSEVEKQKRMNEFTGYNFINTPTSDYSHYFTVSTKSLSVKNKIDDLLYQYTYCTENITITSIPIYHLQPNTRILVKDDETRINGEYIIHKLTIPLTYNGTMSIQASKAPERLY